MDLCLSFEINAFITLYGVIKEDEVGDGVVPGVSLTSVSGVPQQERRLSRFGVMGYPGPTNDLSTVVW